MMTWGLAILLPHSFDAQNGSERLYQPLAVYGHTVPVYSLFFLPVCVAYTGSRICAHE